MTLPPLEIISAQSTGHLDFVNNQRRFPFIVRGAVRNWGSQADWSTKGLRQALSDRDIPVGSSKDGRFGYLPTATWQKRRPSRTFEVHPGRLHAFLDECDNAKGPEASYLMMQRLEQRYPELSQEFSSPPFLGKIQTTSNLWIGQTNSVTPLHFDATSVIICQCSGQKIFQLSPPESVSNFEMFPRHSTHPHLVLSESNLATPLPPNPSGQPLRYDFKLETGDALYIPAFWFHAIRNITTSTSVHFSWLRTHFITQLPPNAANLIPSWYADRGLDQRLATGEIHRATAYLELAREFIRLSDYENAVLLTLSALRQILEPSAPAQGATDEEDPFLSRQIETEIKKHMLRPWLQDTLRTAVIQDKEALTSGLVTCSREVAEDLIRATEVVQERSP